MLQTKTVQVYSACNDNGSGELSSNLAPQRLAELHQKINNARARFYKQSHQRNASRVKLCLLNLASNFSPVPGKTYIISAHDEEILMAIKQCSIDLFDIDKNTSIALNAVYSMLKDCPGARFPVFAPQ